VTEDAGKAAHEGALEGDEDRKSEDPRVAAQPSPGQDWWQTGVVYQIYPRSFADANGDGIGDLAGITNHLDHLAGQPDSLDVDAIWLSPFYPSPDRDFGYDVSDYLGIDPKYGSLEDFERLVEACHRRGMKVVIDLVLNHSSSDHPWFQASRASTSGPYADWYIWRDSPGRSITGRRRPPNNWRSYFGGSAWTWDEGRGQFYHHTFLAEQPDLNWRSPAVREALLGVVRTWLDRGVDGFRMDVFNVFFKDAQLRSNPRRVGGRSAWSWQRHLHDRNQPELHDVLRELRSIVDTRPGTMTVGELFDGMLADAAQLIAPRHLVFDFSLVGVPWSAAAFAEAIEARDRAFGADPWPANVLSNHDQPRHASRFGRRRDGATGGYAEGDARAKVAATLLLTLRGTPFLYYGEEIAQRNLSIPNEQAADPPARRASSLFPWWNRDQARGPMHWRGGPGAGFSTGRPWLPVGRDAAQHNVDAEAADATSVLVTYRRLLRLRRSNQALTAGSQELVARGASNVLAYVRRAGAEAAFVALNFGSQPARVNVPPAAPDRAWRIALSTADRATGDEIAGASTLAPLEALIATQG
jgi:alpha-glucosidase